MLRSRPRSNSCAARTCPKQLFFHQEQAKRLEEDGLHSAFPLLLGCEEH